MKHPAQIIKILGILLLLSLFFLSAAMTVHAAAQISLTRMEKQEGLSQTKLTFFFSELPKFETNHSGQRVDLLLSDVRVSTKLHTLPENETVVKILLAQKPRDLLVSVLLRRPPVQVVTQSLRSPARVEMELFWEKDEASRPGVAFRISDLPARKPGKKAQAYSAQSPWDGHWLNFFRHYRSYWAFKLPPDYTLPLLPALITDRQSPLWPLQQLAAEQQWQKLLGTAGTLSELDDRQRYQRDLLCAEAEIRSAAFAAGLSRLQRLQTKAGDEQLRVDYLTACAQAGSGQPYVAQLTLQGLLPELPASHPLAVPAYLLAAETALASNQAHLALSDLQHADLVWPKSLSNVITLRLADAHAELGERGPALAGYRKLENVKGLFDYYQQSCNRAAFSAFKQGDYGLATRLYRKLAEQVKDQPNDDLLLFAVGAATYESGDLKWGLIMLQKAALEHPSTEGGDRAALRLIDHKLLTGGELGMAQAVNEYGPLAKKSVSRMVREEASFKQALSQDLLGDHHDSVTSLMKFRREFASSALCREADLLLLEQLPSVVEQLLKQKDELQAVVLVEQNRNLLLRGGFNRDFLDDLAGAFERLGLYARAGRVLLYLFDQASGEAQREPVYLPLAKSYLKREDFSEASDYASRYLEKYPHGKDAGALFGILLDAFSAQGRTDELLVWLNRKDRPSSPALEIRAAWLYWEQRKWPDVASSLERAEREAGKLEVKEMALLAEACYQLKRNDKALDIYRQLQNDPNFGTQACYRSAQLLLRDKQPGTALNLLAQLVEKEDSSPWGKLARDLLTQLKE